MSNHAPPSHGPAVVFSILIAAGMLAIAAVSLPRAATGGLRVDEVAVEHAQPLRLSIVVSTGSAVSVIDISHDGRENIRFSTPTTWNLREVRHGRIADLAEAPPSFGFVQRTIPPGTTVSFLLPSPGGLLLHNPSGMSLEIRLKTVDLAHERTSTDVILMKEGTKRLW